MRYSIWFVFAVVGSAWLMNEVAAAAAGFDCGCTLACFGCPFEVKWVQTGEGLLGRQCTCSCHCPPNPFFPGSSPSTPQVPKAPSTPQVPKAPSTPKPPKAPSTPKAPKAPSIPHIPNVPSIPQVPSLPIIFNPSCGAASINVGLCWAQASISAFLNTEKAEGCCNMFQQWADDCFGGNQEIPRIVSNWVPAALVEYCSSTAH